jgi:sugar phosphate isomerase/epimerase
MRISFSTLACPNWSVPQIVEIAANCGYDGVELRFVEGEDSLWKLPAFTEGLAETKMLLNDRGLAIPCVDTSCRFHWVEEQERRRWIEEGERMSDLAAELHAPGIRVFGDTIQPQADRASTQAWIADSIQTLAEKVEPKEVQVWLETHGDFSSSAATKAIITGTKSPNVGVIWDPVNSFIAESEQPRDGAATLGSTIRHVHVKDVTCNSQSWTYTLPGSGQFPLSELLESLKALQYESFLSFEWEKKWHPELADAEIALPHFANWFRREHANSSN